MNLSTFLEKHSGAAAELARGLEATGLKGASVLVSQWKTGRRPIPSDRCPTIERLTGGVVRCEDMRPDVEWSYLRNADKYETTERQG